eukprot:7785692-Heterocapsa_arctica.AAC.1
MSVPGPRHCGVSTLHPSTSHSTATSTTAAPLGRKIMFVRSAPCTASRSMASCRTSTCSHGERWP